MPKSTRTRRNAANKPATETVDPATVSPDTANAETAAAETKPAEKPKPEQHGFKPSYAGASPTVRGHGRKLSPVQLDRIPNSFTTRDDTFLRDLYKQFGTVAFKRLDGDAGAIARLIGHGYVKHVSGALDARDCKFAVTAKAESERFKQA